MKLEFFRPNVLRVILTIVLTILTWFLPLIPVELVIECPGCGTEIFYRSLFLYLIEHVFSANPVYGFMVLFGLAFVNYLVSCLITHFIRKSF